MYLLLAVGLIIPSVRALSRGNIPTTFSGYLLGISVCYLLPFFTRPVSLYESDMRGYTATLVIILMYLFYVSVAYGITPSLAPRKRRTGPVDQASPLQRNWKPIVSTILILVAPILVGVYLHWQVGIDRVFQDFYEYGTAGSRQDLSAAGPLAFLIYPLNGLFIYRLTRGWESRWNAFLTVVVLAMWVFITVLVGEPGTVFLVAAVIAILACTNKRVLFLVVLGIVISATVVGYVVLLRTNPVRVEEVTSSVVNTWAHSVDKLWSLAWAADHGGVTLLDSAVMPAMDGWKYALFAYVPRSVLPEKGYDTARYVALHASSYVQVSLAGETVEDIERGIPVGGPVESILNSGYFGLLLEGLFWGALLSFLDSWLKARGDQVLNAFLFVLSAMSSGTTLFTHVTLFALSILGYVPVTERMTPVAVPLEQSQVDANPGGATVDEPSQVPPEIASQETASSHAEEANELALRRPLDIAEREATGPGDGVVNELFHPAPSLPSPRPIAIDAVKEQAPEPKGVQGVGEVSQVSSEGKTNVEGDRPARDGTVLRPAPIGEPVDELDLVEIMLVLMKRRKLVLTILVAAVATTLLVSWAMPKRYEVVTTILVRDVPQARVAGVTPQTLAAFAVSDRVLLAVGQDVELDVLRKAFNVKFDSTSRILTITVSGPTANDAFTRAEQWLESFTVEASRLIGIEPSESSLVTVFTAPSLPERPVSPRIALNVAVSLVLGAFVGMAAAFVLEGLERVRDRRTW